jgi:demethylmenaquinone methyltransferase/2-methoxy-6-polyprenyl-1,4-benzoquinol methylase
MEEALATPAVKQRFVREMFNIIAPRYDNFTRAFSFGMDARWKAHLLKVISVAEIPDGFVVDLACGTGDLAFALAEAHPRRTVVGVDFSEQMILAAQRRLRVGTTDSAVRTESGHGSHAGGDAAAAVSLPLLALADIALPPLRNSSVALATAGYAFRNVPDFRLALRQLAAAMQPGALLVTLDFYIPENRIWRALFLGWLRVAGKIFGYLWHRSPVVYEYISHSVGRFVTATSFSEQLRLAGFELRGERRWLMGGIAAHFALRLPGGIVR